MSIAWSNFFSRLTHSHPGRVVWVVFNALLALMLMELGIFSAIEKILGLYSNFAVAWIGALVGDLVINKPLGLSPRGIEFRRAHLYDVNPVGVGAMLISIVSSTSAYFGLLGTAAQALAPCSWRQSSLGSVQIRSCAGGRLRLRHDGQVCLRWPATGLPRHP